jgi:hypothetical protein
VVVALARIYLLTVSHRVEDVHQLVVNQPFEAPASIAGVPRNTDEPGRALERRAVQEVGRTPLTVGAYGVEGDGPAYVLVVLPVTVATPPPAADLLAQVARQTGELSDVTMIGVEHGSDIACALLRKTDAGDERACAWVDDTFGYVIGLGPDLRGVARWTGAAREAVRRAR